jgi:hypothetical protein
VPDQEWNARLVESCFQRTTPREHY